MKYRDILGYSKSKKKVVKEQLKPKTNKVLKDIKQKLNESEIALGIQTLKDNPPFQTPKQLKEVGAGAQYRKFYKDIERQQQGLSKSVEKFKKYLEKQGLKSEAQELYDNYLIDSYGWMRKWLKQFISKLM